MAQEGDPRKKTKNKSLTGVKLYPTDSNRLVPTCIRLYPADWNMFQTHEELKGRMSDIARELIHKFLAFDGYSQSDMIEKLRNVDGRIRKLQGEKLTLEQQLSQILNEKFDIEEGILVEERRTLYTTQLKTLWAEQLYILRKSASYHGKERTAAEDQEWIRRKVLESEELRDYSETPEIVLEEIDTIISAKTEEFDTKFKEQFIERGSDRRRKRR